MQSDRAEAPPWSGGSNFRVAPAGATVLKRAVTGRVGSYLMFKKSALALAADDWTLISMMHSVARI
jgi:hypothetical protein